MDLSVIIPTYNRKNVLRHVILSLINQDMDNYEVIICDDGSDDGTKEMVENLNALEFPFELLYCFQEKRGFRAGQARNLGVYTSKGKRIVFLDQDVIIQPNVLKIFNQVPLNSFWSGSKKLVSLDFYNRFVNDCMILDKFEKISSKEFGTIPATLSSFGVINKEDFFKVEGFDEEFNEYGLEDTELIDRLHDIHVVGSVEKNCFGYHIEHDGHKLSRRIQDIYHHKRNNKTKNGKRVE